MEAEVSGLTGLAKGERDPEHRLTHRDGYCDRRWDTRAGTIDLAIPRVRNGSYFPSLPEPRRRAECALLAVVQEGYVAGVSTQRVDDLVRGPGHRIPVAVVEEISEVEELSGNPPRRRSITKVEHRDGMATGDPGDAWRHTAWWPSGAACPKSHGRLAQLLASPMRAGRPGTELTPHIGTAHPIDVKGEGRSAKWQCQPPE
jgi:Transposase, Mutator family